MLQTNEVFRRERCKKRILNKLKTQGVNIDSPFGKTMLDLEVLYDKRDEALNKISYYVDLHDQCEEDIEVLELLIMHKFNKDYRSQKWQSRS